MDNTLIILGILNQIVNVIMLHFATSQFLPISLESFFPFAVGITLNCNLLRRHIRQNLPSCSFSLFPISVFSSG